MVWLRDWHLSQSRTASTALVSLSASMCCVSSQQAMPERLGAALLSARLAHRSLLATRLQLSPPCLTQALVSGLSLALTRVR